MSLREAILKTLAYFDLFDYPLTALEVWRFLYAPGMAPCEFEKVFHELNSLLETKKIEVKNGFYTLPGRAGTAVIRAERYTLSFSKYRRARRLAAFFSLIPGVRMVALGNSMAWRHSRKASDLDFFIVTVPGKIWSARALAAAPIAALGLRPKAGATQDDAVCLSFFASEDALNLRALSESEDIYFTYWVASLVPLSGTSGVFEKFKEQNAWIKEYLPNCDFREASAGRAKNFATSLFKLPVWVENWAARAQRKAFPKNVLELSEGKNTHVVISENYLKFHTEDRREYYRDAWKAKVKELL